MGFSSATTASLINAGAGLTSSVISSQGAYHSARAQRTSLKSQAKLDKINERIATMGAESAMQQGSQQIGALTHYAGQLKGKQRATMAANGVDLGVGSAREVQASTDIMKSIDVGTAKSNALRTAFGYRTQALNHSNSAAMARANASGISPGAAAATTMLGGAAQVATSWYGMRSDMESAPVTDLSSYASIDALAVDKGWW